MYTSKQEVFDKVSGHLARQKVAAVDGDGDCALRAPQGLSCAVGCLIPDEDYDAGMECDSIVNEEGGKGRLGLWLYRNVDKGLYELLVSLQNAHDEKSDWGYQLNGVANSFALTFDQEDFERKLADPEFCY